MEMHADDNFATCFDHASGGTAERFQNPLWPITEIFLGGKLRSSIAVVKEFGRRIVSNAVSDQKLRQKQDGGDTHPESHDGEAKLDQISGSLIQSLLDAIGDETMVADAALTYLSAGRDTTGQALTWTFYLLMRHPDVVSKIRDEVQHVLDRQPDPSPELDPTRFTPVSMPYTMAVFYESLRLYPPIPFEIRQCTEAVTLPDGTFLPKHSVLVWCLWAMHRSSLTWGEDADEFRPDRFLDLTDPEDPKLATARSAAEFPVFYGGPRTCLGKKMAEAIAVQVIPTVAWQFDFAPAGWDLDGAERVSKTSLTMPMEGGLPVLAQTRR